jgi:hypothetical protein
MYEYHAYGLLVRSVLPLPELQGVSPTGVRPRGELVVSFGSVGVVPSVLNGEGVGFWSDGEEACHYVEKVGAFLVRRGREIVVEPAPGVEDRTLRLSVLGPALGLALHQRGFLVLHGSVVAHGDATLAILGANGWGKSTLAAALCRKGYTLVADDLAAVATEGELTVMAGFPQVKLWPESVRLLGDDPERLAALHPGFDKRAWRAEQRFAPAARRLTDLYVIASGPEPALERLSPRQACLELLAHWYGHRFGGGLLRASADRHLRQCAALADHLPMHRLFRSGGPATLLRLADLIDEEVRRRTPAQGEG